MLTAALVLPFCVTMRVSVGEFDIRGHSNNKGRASLEGFCRFATKTCLVATLDMCGKHALLSRPVTHMLSHLGVERQTESGLVPRGCETPSPVLYHYVINSKKKGNSVLNLVRIKRTKSLFPKS